MAIQGPIPVEFGHVFPRGAFAAGGFEPVRDFEASKAGRFVQSKDKASGLPLWVTEVIDGDPQARDKTARVKIAAADQPVLPAGTAGMPFVPVEFRRADGHPIREPGRAAGLLPQGHRGARPRPRPRHRRQRRNGGLIEGGAAGSSPFLPPLVLSPDSTREEVTDPMRGSVRGEQYAQVDNPDSFASPVWRSPVYRTPEFVIWIVQLARLTWRVLWFAIRHPGFDLTAGTLMLVWANTGWQGLVTVAGVVVTILAAIRLASPRWFTRLVSGSARDRWRWWCYRRRWQAVMTISRLAPLYQGRVLLPVLGRVASSRFTDRVTVGIVSGQSPKDFADKAEGLAHGFGVRQCRVRSGRPGTIVLELVRRDALADPVPALPIPDVPDLRALPVGRREDGAVLAIRLHGTHLLIAGATGAGKGSWVWGLIRAMLPAMAAGLVRVLACDPKLMELAFGRALFDRHGRYAADPADIAALLEDAVADMQARAARFAGKQRDHVPTAEFPFVVVIVDEIAFLTAYQADRKLRERTLAALATLTTQGRAVGYCVVAALQDPRKEVLNIRNLFPDKIALRLDEPSQADLVLGDGARDRGAMCDQISSDPRTGAGVGFIRLEADPDPVRVRAAFVSDDDIRAMTAAYAAPAWRAAPMGDTE